MPYWGHEDRLPTKQNGVSDSTLDRGEGDKGNVLLVDKRLACPPPQVCHFPKARCEGCFLGLAQRYAKAAVYTSTKQEGFAVNPL